MATGHNLVVGLKKNANTWGTGLAVLAGAGDGIEVDSESLAIDAQLIENVGLFGQGTQRPSKLGEKLLAGDLPCPLYYVGLETAVALAMGATGGAPSQLGGTTAYELSILLAASLAGEHSTIAMGGVDHPSVREIAFSKGNGFTFDFQRNQLAKLTLPQVGYDLFNNVGAPDPDLVVVAVEPTDVTLTIAAQPSHPSFLTITVTDSDTSITEYIVTITGLDDDGNYATETYTLSSDGLTWTSSIRWSSITALVGSGLAGTATSDTIEVGVQPGVNNVNTYTSITVPTTADYELVAFDQVRIWMNEQSAGALDLTASTDEFFMDAIRVTLNPSLVQNVTTRFGNRVEEPHAGDFKKVELGFNFPSWDSANNALLRDRLLGKKFKVHIRAQGPLADTGFPLEWSIWLNEVQFGTGSPNAGGPGDIRFDLTGMAHRAIVNPTGLPSWANQQPIALRNVSLRTTDPLA